MLRSAGAVPDQRPRCPLTPAAAPALTGTCQGARAESTAAPQGSAMPSNDPADQAEHTRRTREAYDQLAPVWSSDTELVSDTWRKAGVEVSQQFWRRPLGAVFGAFADAGFVVDRIAEPQPSDEALRLFPDKLAGVVGIPWFIVYRL